MGSHRKISHKKKRVASSIFARRGLIVAIVRLAYMQDVAPQETLLSGIYARRGTQCVKMVGIITEKKKR